MWLLDQWAERHILDAQSKGEFDNLTGSGEPLLRRDAMALSDLLKTVEHDDPRYTELNRRLTLFELKLRQAGMNTDFLRGDYADRLWHKINEE